MSTIYVRWVEGARSQTACAKAVSPPQPRGSQLTL